MGLAAEFKSYVREKFPGAIESPPPPDVCVVDAMCSIHSFSPDLNEDAFVKPLNQLANRILNVAGPCAPGATLVVVFDRQGSTTEMKLAEQARRSAAKKRKITGPESRKWDVSEVDAMLSRGNVPSDWEAFLDDRNMRARMVEALSGVFFERFHDSPFMKKVERMIVVNGRCGFDMARGEGPRAQIADRSTAGWREADAPEAPWTGEADVAMARWVRQIISERDAELGPPVVCVHTVDTDLVPLFMLHGGERCFVCLSASRPEHCMKIDTHKLTELMGSEYKLSLRDLVAVIILKKTDFTKPCLKGLPDWHMTMKLAGNFLSARPGRLVVDENGLNVAFFKNMLNNIAFEAGLSKKRVVAASLQPDDERRLKFVTKYWIELEGTPAV